MYPGQFYQRLSLKTVFAVTCECPVQSSEWKFTLQHQRSNHISQLACSVVGHQSPDISIFWSLDIRQSWKPLKNIIWLIVRSKLKDVFRIHVVSNCARTSQMKNCILLRFATETSTTVAFGVIISVGLPKSILLTLYKQLLWVHQT